MTAPAELAYRPAELGELRELRYRLLRPHQRPSDLVYDGDDDPDALHLGAFDGERLVGIASVAPDPSEPWAPGAWRLRGMATEPGVRGRGVGGELLERCMEHAAERGAALVWCNARVRAEPFYRRHGFEPVGEVFDVPPIGPHVRMVRRLR